MKVVKVFIGSSAELDEDKTRFDLYFSEKNKLYRKRYIDFDQRTWKDFVSTLTHTGRLQDRYNEYINQCDIAVFLFHSKMGQYTLEELQKAQECFQRSGKKPRIFIYFKETENQDAEMSIFKKTCEKELGHFCDVYSSYEDLLMKFDKQLQLLENERFIQSDPIDLPRIIRFVSLYVLLPLIVVILGYLTFYYFTPNTVTIRVQEVSPTPLAFEGADISLQYADKNEMQHLDALGGELIYKEVHSRYMGKTAKILFTSPGFQSIDTTLVLSGNIVLPIHRDNSFGHVFGMVKDENNVPVERACVAIGELRAITNENGYFSIDIPAHLQSVEQRIVVTKKGYELWDFTGPVSNKIEWKIILRR